MKKDPLFTLTLGIPATPNPMAQGVPTHLTFSLELGNGEPEIKALSLSAGKVDRRRDLH